MPTHFFTSMRYCQVEIAWFGSPRSLVNSGAQGSLRLAASHWASAFRA